MTQSLKISYLSLSFLALLLMSAPLTSALAEDTAPAITEGVNEGASLMPVAGDKIKAMEIYTAELMQGLAPEQAQYIYAIRQNYGIIYSVQTVKKDIGKAISSCGQENPEMKSDLDTRFTSWDTLVTQKINDADDALKDAIQRQSFRPTVRLSILLDRIQEAFEERDAQIKKVPVTTADSCAKLLKSLDNTETDLTKLLDDTAATLTTLSATPDQTANVAPAE